MKIEGARTYLTPFTEGHLVDPRYIEWLRDIEVVRLIGREEYLTPIPFDRVREYVEDLWRSRYCSFFAIHHASTGQFIGTIKVNYLNDTGLATRTADIGVMIGERSFWGKGVATDALRTICEYAFDTLGARKLTAGAAAPNEAVIRAFRKIGFSEEGRLRQKLLISGEYMDHVLLGCFRDDLISSGAVVTE